MTGLVAYLALVVVVPALLLGHQGQDWPLRGAWRGATGPLWARGRVEARMFARARVRPPERRVRLRSARVPRPDTGTTGPSRPRIRCCAASQGERGAFPAPTTPEPSQGRTELSITKEAA